MIVSNINEDDNLAIRKEVKNRKLHIEKKDVKKKILKKHKPADLSREAILKKARKKAHQSTANVKRDLSNDMRKSISESAKLFESFDFIEESYGYGEVLNFQIYEEPVENSTITEALCVDHSYVDPKYLTIGMAEGCFAPIGVMSRNNRIYDEDHYPYLLSDEMLMNRVHSRAMLGTIGHHDKRVDDEDLANDVCSHVVTELEVRENAEGQPYLYGKLEILNTTAGRRLRQLYEHGIPLYVSSRGGGKLLPVPNKTYKRVDKQHYFLETFDVVKEPGFLDANPTPHVSSSVNESIDNKDNGEIVMEQELQKDTSIVEEKETTVVDEAKEEKEAKEAEEKEEKVDEAKEAEEKEEADKEDEEEKVEESVTETVSEEVAPTAHAPKTETEDDEDETAKGDIAKDGVHEEKEHDKDCDCEDCKAKKEEEKVDEADASSEKVLADIDKIVKTVCEEKEADEEDKEAEEKEEEKVDEAKEEVTVVEEDYKAKYEALEPVLEELINMIKDASAKIKAIQEENASHKAQIMELTEKLNVSEEQDMHQDPDDDTEVDGPADTEDKPDDMHEAKEEDKEKEEAEEEKEEKVEESVTETVSESVETEAEELGEQIAESADINISEEIKPTHRTIEVYSAFKKEENIKPSKYFSRFSNFNK